MRWRGIEQRPDECRTVSVRTDDIVLPPRPTTLDGIEIDISRFGHSRCRIRLETAQPKPPRSMHSPTMSTWEDLVSCLRSAYRPAEDTGGLVKIFCKRGDGESQLMIVERVVDPDFPNEVWATIQSPVATPHCVDAGALLRQAAGGHVVGGVVRVGDVLYLRHSLPLTSMSLHDFVAPFQRSWQLRPSWSANSCQLTNTRTVGEVG